MEELSQKIFRILQTKNKVNEFIIFSDVIDALFSVVGEVDLNERLKTSFGNILPTWIDTVYNDLPNLKQGKILQEDIDILKSVRNVVQGAKEVKIEMPFYPSDSFIDGAVRIFNEVGKDDKEGNNMNIILDIDVKESSEVGAKVFVGGQFIDLNLRNRVVNYLSSEDVINRYL